MYKFKFADIGEGLHEGVVGEVYKKVGDMVQEGDSLFSVETDKVTSDIPSPVSGKVLKVLVKTGETVHVGDDVFHFDAEGAANAEAPAPEVAKEPEQKSVANNTVATPTSNGPRRPRPVRPHDVQTSSNQSPAPAPVSKPQSGQPAASLTIVKQNGVLATPLARRLAAQKNIDINTVTGTGQNGKILVADIENWKQTAPSTQVSSQVASKQNYVPGGETRVKITPIRKAIANAMSNSWNNVAYSNLVLEADLTTLWNQRKSLTTKPMIEKLGIKLSFLPFIIKATAKALAKYPKMNSKYDEKTQETIQYHDKNIGIAVDTPSGLVVPVIKNVEQKSLITIGQELVALAVKARDKKLQMSEMQGGTFTITNYGSVGALYGVPVINYPELAIMGTGAIIDQVKMDENGHFVNKKIMHLTTAADHRFIDGADVGRFAMEVKKILENPILLMEEFDV